MPPKKNSMSAAAIEELIAQHSIDDALATYDANRNSRNGNGDGDGSHDSRSSGRRMSHTTRGCTYKEFLNYQPLNFKGTEGAVGLAHWFEKMESVFHISNGTVECQVKYATCTLLGGALTWLNSHIRTVGHDAAYEMPWMTLIKMMTENYYPRSEIKKLEIELWNLKVLSTDVVSYTQRFQELALLCARMLPEESERVKKYIGGLPDSIQGNVMSARPKTLQEAIKLAKYLMDQKVHTYAERQADNKRRFENNPGDNQVHNRLPRGKMWLGLTILGLVKIKCMLELYHCATSAIFTTMGCALQSARTVKELVMWPETVGVLLLLTIKEPLLALYVGIKGTTVVNARN
ncbi:reverse transcriptase domain-containing protein [Tanacetum coccineum]